MSYNITFMGSGDFAATVLRKLSLSDFKPAIIFTQPDKPVGRHQTLSPSPVKKVARNLGLKIFEPKNLKNEEVEKLVKSLAPDLIIVADYGKVIPKNILDIPKDGSLNIHPSLLPRYRGATPIYYTILSGDKKTGVSIILMDEQVDHGPIVAAVDYKSEISEIGKIELTEKLAELGAELLIEILPDWFSGVRKPVPQNESLATYTKILTKEDGKIDWKKSAVEIERQIRAFEGWPGTWTKWPAENKKIKIFDVEIIDSEINSKKPGEVFLLPDGGLAIACGSGSLFVNELQIEGKSKIKSQEFLRGYPGIIGQILV